VTYLPRGMRVCFQAPPEPARTAAWRLAYFDERPALNRWVFLNTALVDGMACAARVRVPATFAEFAEFGAIP
jgi:hypothetical protein